MACEAKPHTNAKTNKCLSWKLMVFSNDCKTRAVHFSARVAHDVKEMFRQLKAREEYDRVLRTIR